MHQTNFVWTRAVKRGTNRTFRMLSSVSDERIEPIASASASPKSLPLRDSTTRVSLENSFLLSSTRIWWSKQSASVRLWFWISSQFDRFEPRSAARQQTCSSNQNLFRHQDPRAGPDLFKLASKKLCKCCVVTKTLEMRQVFNPSNKRRPASLFQTICSVCVDRLAVGIWTFHLSYTFLIIYQVYLILDYTLKSGNPSVRCHTSYPAKTGIPPALLT